MLPLLSVIRARDQELMEFKAGMLLRCRRGVHVRHGNRYQGLLTDDILLVISSGQYVLCLFRGELVDFAEESSAAGTMQELK